jgi:hypothetical protein
VARAEPETSTTGPDDGQRVRIRIISIVVAVVLMATAAVVLTRHHPPPRSSQAFCARMADVKDLGTVLASGDASQITASVHRFDQAAQVAPPPIEAQVAVLTTYADGLARAVTQTSDAKAGLRTALAAQQGQLTAVNAAGKDLDQYVATTCHLTLAPAGTDTVPTLATTGSTVPG